MRDPGYEPRESPPPSQAPKGPPPGLEGKSPSMPDSGGMDTTYANISSSDPPKYDIARYEPFLKEILRGRDIHGLLGDYVLISHWAVQATGDT